MQIPRMLVAFGASLPLASARAATALQAPVKVEVSVPASHTIWYTDPMWLAIGAVAVLVVIMIAVMASRKGDTKSTTTVIR